MTLGEKLRQARLRNGLSQSQVAGSFMTRNMLSQLENDLASPSVKTLLYLSETLGVSSGWLLDDAQDRDCVTCKEEARALFQKKEYLKCLNVLCDLDAGMDDEVQLILVRCACVCAEQAIREQRHDDADHMLRCAERCQGLYIGDGEKSRVGILRLKWCLSQNMPNPELLEKVADLCNLNELRTIAAEHDFLSGRKAAETGRFDDALVYLHRAESASVLPRKSTKELYCLLEQCYKEKEDYKQAYRYASLRLNNG